VALGRGLGQGLHQRPLPGLHDLLVLDQELRFVVLGQRRFPSVRDRRPFDPGDETGERLRQVVEIVAELEHRAAQQPVALKIAGGLGEFRIASLDADGEAVEVAFDLEPGSSGSGHV
jgi:hypothetical protein